MYVAKIMVSSEYHQAFTKTYSDLVSSLKSEYADLTDRLFSESLISEDIRDTVRSRTTGQTETERTRILLDAVRDKISENPKNYHKFFKVLTGNAVYEDVATLLQKKVQTIQIENKQQTKSVSVLSKKKKRIVILFMCTLLVGLFVFYLLHRDFFITCDCIESDELESAALHISDDNSKSEASATDIRSKTASHNLPQRSSRFFGRENNVTYLSKMLLKQNRIININGPPAFGKSSLAIKIGWTLIDNYSTTFKEVRYIDTTTTKSSIYLCSNEQNKTSSTPREGKTKSVIGLNDTDSQAPHQSDTEPNLCEWSKTRPHRTLLILDNCDSVLRDRRQEFINLIINQFYHCCYVGNLSIIITSQEKLQFLDDLIQSFSIAELDPADSVTMLSHYVPNLSSEMAHNFSTLVGHCPLALKVVGRLLAARGIENVGTLLESLEKKTVSTISNKMTDSKEKFMAIMDLAYTNLDIDHQECSLIFSLFPSSFESTIGSNILAGIVDPDCVEKIAQKSIVDEYFIADKTRYTMHKLVQSYFFEIRIKDSFYLLNQEHFKSNFITFYSTYLLKILKDRYKFKNVTDEEVHRIFYLENLNLEYFSKVLMSKGNNLTDENVLAFSFLIIENIISTIKEKEFAFTQYFFTRRRLYSDLCRFSSNDVCSHFIWKLLVVGLQQCIVKSDISPSFHSYEIYWQIIFDGIPICEIFACKTLSFLMYDHDTFSNLAQKMDNPDDQFILSIFKTSYFFCQAKWFRILILVSLGLIVFLLFCTTFQWFKKVCSFSFKQSVSLMKQHFFVCCIVNYLNDYINSFQWIAPSTLNRFIYFSLPISALLTIVFILCVAIFLKGHFEKFLHPRNRLVLVLSDVLLTMDVQILYACNKDWYSFYTHFILSTLFTFLLSKKRSKKDRIYMYIHVVLFFGFFFSILLFSGYFSYTPVYNFIGIDFFIPSVEKISDIAKQ